MILYPRSKKGCRRVPDRSVSEVSKEETTGPVVLPRIEPVRLGLRLTSSSQRNADVEGIYNPCTNRRTPNFGACFVVASLVAPSEDVPVVDTIY